MLDRALLKTFNRVLRLGMAPEVSTDKEEANAGLDVHEKVCTFNQPHPLINQIKLFIFLNAKFTYYSP